MGEVLDQVDGEEAADERTAEANREGPEDVALPRRMGVRRSGGRHAQWRAAAGGVGPAVGRASDISKEGARRGRTSQNGRLGVAGERWRERSGRRRKLAGGDAAH